MVGIFNEEYVCEHFARRLKKAFDMSPKSIVKISSEAGVSRNSIYKYLDGKMKPSIDTVCDLCEALEIPIEFFSEDSFEMNEYIYIWSSDDELSHINSPKREEVHGNYPNKKDGGRITNEIYSKLELIGVKTQNRTLLKKDLEYIESLIKAVDEPTKHAMFRVLREAIEKLELIKEDYYLYKQDHKE